MKTIYTPKHLLHAPETMVVAGRETPHCEVPQRAETIISAIRLLGFPVMEPNEYAMDLIRQVHDEGYLHYLSNIYEAWVAARMPHQGVIPDTFPTRFNPQKPAALAAQAGWYCFDTCAPIVQKTWETAVSSANCALTGAGLLLGADKTAYALCRPPGHHAGPGYCGGFCYLNNVAIAARYLLQEYSKNGRKGKVAILDLDYHHGNGTEDIFREEPDVLFVSIHGDPGMDFPFYWGRPLEKTNAGTPAAINLPLPPGTIEKDYMVTLNQALESVGRFGPDFLLVSFGTDTYKVDPMGLFQLETGSYSLMGKAVAALSLPTLIIQEGGYNTGEIGTCVTNFLKEF